jgi:hypothetical protein
MEMCLQYLRIQAGKKSREKTLEEIEMKKLRKALFEPRKGSGRTWRSR